MRVVVQRYASELSLVGVIGFALALIVLLGPAEEAQASGIRYVRPGVDNSSYHIQQAIDAAEAGDTIIVEGGRYTGGIVISKRVNLIGQGAEIDGIGGSRPLTVIGAGIGPDVQITGFTFVNGDASAGASNVDGTIAHEPGCGGNVLFRDASPSFVGNIVLTGRAMASFDGTPVEGRGGGLCLMNSNALVINNTISGHDAGGFGANGKGGGIYVQGGAPTVRGNTISGNYGSRRLIGQGGGLYLENTTALVEHNTIAANGASPCGDLIEIDGEPENECLSTQAEGGGIYIDGGQPVLRYNYVTRNFASRYRGATGGVFVNNSAATLAGNVITGNAHGGDGYHTNGLRIQNSQGFELDSNVLARNSSPPPAGGVAGGIAITIFESRGVLRNTTIVDNDVAGTTADNSAALYVQGASSDVTAVNTIIAGHDVAVWQRTSGARITLQRTLFVGNGEKLRGSGSGLTNADEVLPDVPDAQKDPRFVDAAGVLPSYRLRADSPARDAGSSAPAGALDADARARQIGPAPDLGAYEFLTAFALAATASANPVTAGGELTLSYRYGVEGELIAAGSTLTATLPPGSSEVSASHGGLLSGQTVTWQLGDLPPSQGNVVTVRLRAPEAPGAIQSAARLTSADGLAAETIVGVTVRAPDAPGLAVSLQPSHTTAVAGQRLTLTAGYEVSGAAVSGAAVVLTLPAGASAVAAEQGGAVSGQTVTWQLGDLPAGASGALSASFTVPGAPGTAITASARISGGGGSAESTVVIEVAAQPAETERPVYLPFVLR